MRSSRTLFLTTAALLAGCGGGGHSSPSGPRITEQPGSVTAALGAAATFRVVATGADPTYQWTKNGADIPGATEATYTIASVATVDAGFYGVRVTSGGRTRTSDPAILAIQGAPRIASGPTNVTTTAGSAATFAVGATGDAPLSYQWSFNGTPIDGATGASYTVASVGSSTVGVYAVTVSNPKGSVRSGDAVLAIGVPQPPTISGQPNSQTAAAGTPVGFSVVASGPGPLTYQWTKDGANISGATDANYAIPSVATTDAGVYRVVVTGSEGSVTSAAATLTVVVLPVITTQPQSLTINPGQAATFSVTASGSGLSYQWTKGGTNVAGATGESLTLASATATDAGSYAVKVTNNAGTVTSDAATLTVRVPPSIAQQPVIVVTGGSTAVRVVASGTNIVYQWYRNGAAVGGANAATYTLGTVNAGNRGVYTVVVSNVVGSVTSGSVNVL